VSSREGEAAQGSASAGSAVGGRPEGALAGLDAWVVTDGKAGDEGQCLALAEALGLVVSVRRIAPRPLYALLAPRGPVDPREAPGRPGGPLAGPFPRLLIASGRRAVPSLRAVRARSPETFTVFLKDPRTGAGTADFLWVPAHDRLRGDNVIATWTPPHRVSAERLAAARAVPDPRLAGLARPRVAVLVGGDSRHGRFRPEHAARLVADLDRLAGEGASLMATTSRRTPAALRAALAGLIATRGGILYDGAGENPYLAMLALADAVVVTADSANMVGEAAATGVPVLLAEGPNISARHRRLYAALAAEGAVRPLTGRLEAFRYKPLDATPAIARAVADAYLRRRAALDRP
jgi:uncharacterized protein